ncbi:ribonucleotide reductase of class III [Bacteriophage Eos]|nr:ribonucleotide reductase of class III [Bacteriophage Eos]
MKVHKIDKKRIYFTMDSGAYGSISKGDVKKLQFLINYEIEGKIDPRQGECIAEQAKNQQIEILRKLNNE